MTAGEVLDNALAILATSRAQSPEYVQHAVPLINLLLAQTFECNNGILAARGQEEQRTIYAIERLEDELPCAPELARTAIPLGLCARLVMDDDDMARTAYYQNEYVAAVEDAGRWVAGPVADVYGGGA